MATTTKYVLGQWDTFHNNGPFPTKMLYKTSLEGEGNMPSVYDRYNDAGKEIQNLIKEVSARHEGLRAYGSAWSLSNIAHHEDNMHYNGKMNLKKPITQEELQPGSLFKRENLFFFQCGNTIKEVSKFLFDHGKSLKMSGASNGQTIAGCVSTGVHGSALAVGSVQDCVIGINLIIGPEINDRVYIERTSNPALTDDFAKSINSRVIRDDGLFNAALVGLGAYGFLHAVVIEAEDRFLLQRYVKKISKEKALALADTLNFKDTDLGIPSETGPDGTRNTPYHYKIFINPYNNENEYVIEAMYKKAYRTDYPDPFPRIKTALYTDLINLFCKISERFPGNIPKIINLLRTEALPKPDAETIGTLSEIFWDAAHQGKAFACSVGVDHKDSSRALNLLIKLTNEEGPIPGIYAMRFVKASKATLAFTKFPVTCMLEIDGVLWKGGNKIISLEQFSKRMAEVLKANNIPFTLHWGKNGAWSFPGLVEHMFGNNVKIWKDQRSKLLSPEMLAVFSNGFLKTANLA